MKRVLIIGAGKGGTALINIIRSTTSMKVVAVIDRNESANGMELACQLAIPTGTNWKEWLSKDLDIIMEATGDPEILDEIIHSKNKNTVVIPGTVAYIISELVDEKNALFDRLQQQMENKELILNHIMLEAIIQSSYEAISVVDENGYGIMINPAYTRITGLTEKDVIGKPATVDIYEGESMHMKVLQTGESFNGVRMKVGQYKKDVIVNVAPIIVNHEVRGSVGVLHDVSEIQSLTKELKRAQQIIRTLEAKHSFNDIIGLSSELTLALEQAKVGARTPSIVLLRGESGTGKELFAQAIHNESERKNNIFMRVNCAAIEESLLEIELFGYETNEADNEQDTSKIGAFEEANNGSVFLDEIGELSLNMQIKLLRVIQEKEIMRVGGATPIPVDVRIITATNKNLEKAIMNRTFREDLYYRLSRLPIFIPPLRERISDIPELVHHTIQKLNEDYGRTVRSVDSEAMVSFETYHWPGNVRELENVIARAFINMDTNDEIIKKEHLPKLDQSSLKEKPHQFIYSEWDSLNDAVENFEKEYILEVYKDNAYNKTKTAKALDISIRNLYYKIDKYELE